MGDAVARVLASRHVALSFTRAPLVADDLAANAALAADFAAVLARTSARAGLVQALADATARMQSGADEQDFAVQQALRREIEELDAAMIRLAESRRSD
jgi:DNA primase